MDEAQAASIVRGAVGQSGRNEDYVMSTVQHLEALGIRDHWMEEVARRMRRAEPPRCPGNETKSVRRL